MFEKKDSRVKSAAATNLSFLYFLVSQNCFTGRIFKNNLCSTSGSLQMFYLKFNMLRRKSGGEKNDVSNFGYSLGRKVGYK